MKNRTMFASALAVCAGCLLISGFALGKPADKTTSPLGHGQVKKLPMPTSKISPVTAMSTAKSYMKGGTAFSANFEYEDGAWVYGVLVVKGHTVTEVLVNATTGKVGDSEGVTPEDEAAEVKSELTKIIAEGG